MAEGLARGNGQLAKMDSTESRWAARDQEDSEDDSEEEGEESSRRMSLDSEEEEDNVEQRLIRTGPRIDSFDVEALEVPGAHRNDFEVSTGSQNDSFLEFFMLVCIICQYILLVIVQEICQLK